MTTNTTNDPVTGNQAAASAPGTQVGVEPQAKMPNVGELMAMLFPQQSAAPVETVTVQTAKPLPSWVLPAALVVAVLFIVR